MLVSLKKFGVEDAVNPEYVTSVQAAKIRSYKPDRPELEDVVELWVVGNAGYGTFRIVLHNTTVEAVRRYLNQQEHKYTKEPVGSGK